MLEIKQFIFGPFETNTYVIRDPQGEVWLIDPACSSQYEQMTLYNYIEKDLQLGDKGLHIVATHGHLDHLWGAKWATEQWHTPVLMHEADIPMAEAMQQQYDMFGIRKTAEPFPMEPMKMDAWKDVEVIETPGHTPGSVCLYWPKEDVLISGDTLFRMGYGRTDLPGGDIGQLYQSLCRLMQLPLTTCVYSGHGESTTIEAEKTYMRL